MDVFSAIPLPFHSMLLLLVVLLIKFGLSAIAPHNPWQFFSFFCEQLANKVNKPENGEQQQRISGLVATLVTFTPLWIILWLFADFVEITLLWQGLLLYLALGPLSLKRHLKKVINDIATGNKYRAKQALQPWLRRDTQQLSPMGLAKAAIEMVILRHLQEVIVVIMLYLVGGALFAISYRLLLEMHYAWNPKVAKHTHFGKFVHTVVLFISWLPSRIMLIVGLFLSLGQQSTLLWRLSLPLFFKLSNNALIQFYAQSLNIKLGGVAMYDGVKLRREEFNSKGRPPEIQDIVHSYQFIDRVTALIAIIVTASYFLWWATQNTVV